jgi:hypothetical protein
MTSFGKTIRLFLVDGTTNGLTTAELSNWTGIGIRVPKIKIKEYQARPEFQKPGVYILVGKGENNEDAAYIGEAEVIRDRLIQHTSGKDFWNEVVFFGSKDKYLNKASVKYLENRLFELARQAGRYRIEQNVPTRSELSEAEQAELEEFLAHIKVLCAALGYRLFEKPEETLESTPSNQQVFFCRNTTGIVAKGSPSTEGFLVFKDSLFVREVKTSTAPGVKRERQQLIDAGTLVPEGDAYRLTKDYIFSSSSRAADSILGRSASGPLEWKTEAGATLRHFEQLLTP